MQMRRAVFIFIFYIKQSGFFNNRT
jgi:hypothetical protein